MNKKIILALSVLSFLVCGYSLLGFLMAGVLFGGPNYTNERQLNLNFWGFCTAISVLAGLRCLVLIWKRHRF